MITLEKTNLELFVIGPSAEEVRRALLGLPIPHDFGFTNELKDEYYVSYSLSDSFDRKKKIEELMSIKGISGIQVLIVEWTTKGRVVFMADGDGADRGHKTEKG